MALQNAEELAEVLDSTAHLGPVFARHAYGMRAWVDLFSAHVAALPDPRLRGRAGAGAARAQALAAEAHELYRVRELAEVQRYAHAA